MIGRHASDERLSAHVDGARAPAHLARCDRCRTRLAGMEQARRLVRVPLAAVDPEVRASAVAAVLRAAEPTAGAPGESTAPGAATPFPVPAVPTGGRPAWPRRRLVGVAATLVVLGGAVGVSLALALSHQAPRSSASSSPLKTPVHGAAKGTSKAAVLPGEQGAAVPSASGPAAATGTPSGSGAGSTALAGPNVVALGAQIRSAAAHGVVSLGVVPSLGDVQDHDTALNGHGAPASSATITVFEDCIASLERSVGSDRVVERLATVTVGRTTALVYELSPVFGAPESKSSSELVVTASSGCRLMGTLVGAAP